MLDKNDVRYWLSELEKHPETAPELIRLLASRLQFLDKQNEELRAELIQLRRGTIRAADAVDTLERTAALEKQVAQLQQGTPQITRAIIYSPTHILFNAPVDALALGSGSARHWDAARGTIASSSAQLTLFTPETRIFQVNSDQLPSTTDLPVAFDNPAEVIGIIDAMTLKTQRFLLLLSAKGYLYSALSASVGINAKSGQPLLRNLIPDDPITAVIPSDNADVLCVSRAGRWARFPQRSIEGTGSLAMNPGKTDRIAAVVPLSSETILIFLTEDNRLFARQSAALTAKRTPGHASAALIMGVNIAAVTTQPAFNLLTSAGRLLPFRLQPHQGRMMTEDGYRLSDLADGEQAIGVI